MEDARYRGVEFSRTLGLRPSARTKASRETCHTSSRPAYGGSAATCMVRRAAAASVRSAYRRMRLFFMFH